MGNGLQRSVGGGRKTTPHVVRGRVKKKNNWALSTDYYDAPQPRMVVIDRKRPGVGYKHVLTKSDIYQFLEILPDWNTLAVGLHAIVLTPGSYYNDGYHCPGVVHVNAWEDGLWREASQAYYDAHREIWERLGVLCEQTGDDCFLCKFDEPAVRAYQLLHILLHELGHHHDRMTTRSQKRSTRGEAFAENYAVQYESAIWDKYQRVFG